MSRYMHMFYSQNTNTDFPELVIAVKSNSYERIQSAGLVYPAYQCIILYITVIKNRRARTHLHCPICKVTRSCESFSGFNSNFSSVGGNRECL